MTSGSVLWQTAFTSFAIALILFELIRGWHLGLMRQIARIFAVIGAYAAAIFGGRLLLPLARPFLRMPDSLIAILAGAVLALLIYSVICSLGRIFFKRTNEQSSSSWRTLSGFSGAGLGLLFGVFLVWLLVVGIRSLGAVADGQMRAEAGAKPVGAAPQAVYAVYSSSADSTGKKKEPSEFVAALARLKNSIELGPMGHAVKQTDLVSQTTYDLLNRIGQLLSQPESAQRFLAFPGVLELSQNPKIVALRDDPEIADLIARGRFFDLLQNDKVLDAANDPDLVRQIAKLDLRSALDFALKK